MGTVLIVIAYLIGIFVAWSVWSKNFRRNSPNLTDPRSPDYAPIAVSVTMAIYALLWPLVFILAKLSKLRRQRRNP